MSINILLKEIYRQVNIKMNLSQALKAGILPTTANPIELILTMHKEGMGDLLSKQINRHHQIMKKAKNVNDARNKFMLTCDFTEAELNEMNDLKIWEEGDVLYREETISILKTLRKKKIYRPVDDSTVTNCYHCNNAFSMFNRRHHCRACGRIFCYSCSQWSERIPEDLVNYTDTKTWIVPGQLSRVCQSCKDIISNFRKIEHLVKYFDIVAYPLELCIKASTLCRDWREAMRVYLSNLRDLQYSLPSTLLKERDYRALQTNLDNIQGHNKWILQALKMGSIPLEERRIRDCQDMMCDRNCTVELTPYDAIIILNTPVYNVEVKMLALQILENNEFPRNLSLFLPIEDLGVQQFIIKRPELFFDFFWLSRINQELPSGIFNNKLLLANPDKAESVQESINLVSMLQQYTDPYELSQKLQSLKLPFMGPFGVINSFDSEITIKSSATRPIVIKYTSDGVKRAFLYKREDVRKDAHVIALIKIMYQLCNEIFTSSKNSTFLPVSAPIDIDTNKYSSRLFTKDSPISSPVSISSSRHWKLNESSPVSIPDTNLSPLYCSEIIEEEVFNFKDMKNVLELDETYLATYRVMPVSVETGFIEIVPNSLTLFDILSRGTISNYLYRSNSDKRVSEVNSNYSASLAFWTVVTYLLGVGDRHLENIMIRSDGILFHIDYGFVFGADITASFIRLDHNLIEGLGGVEMYEPFKNKCCEIYCCLRRHFNLICACLLRLASIKPAIKGYSFTNDFIENFVTERFLLGQTEEEAKEAFSVIIDSSRETLLNKVSDVIHNTVSSLKVGWWSY